MSRKSVNLFFSALGSTEEITQQAEKLERDINLFFDRVSRYSENVPRSLPRF